MKPAKKGSKVNLIASPFEEKKRERTPAVPFHPRIETINEYSDPSDLDESFEIIPDVMVSQHVDIVFKDDSSASSLAFDEYKTHIIKNLKANQHLFLPIVSFCSCAPEFRFAFVDWILRVCDELQMNDDTAYIAVDLFDRIYKARQIKEGHLQLFAATAVWIACKLEETLIPQLADFKFLCDDVYDDEEFCECEKAFCFSLNYSLIAPSPLTFLTTMLSDSKDTEFNDYCKFLVNVSAFASLYPTTKPSSIAESCIYLTSLILKKPIDASIKSHLVDVNLNEVCLFSLSCIEAYQILLNPKNEELYSSLKEKHPQLENKLPVFTEDFVKKVNPITYSKL